MPVSVRAISGGITELLLPRVVRRLGHADLATNIDDGRARLGQPQRVGDLLFAESRSLHRFSLRPFGAAGKQPYL